MATNYFNNRLLQKFLFSVADRISYKLSSFPTYNDFQNGLRLVPNSTTTSPTIATVSDAQTLITRQSQIISTLPLPNKESAVEIFADKNAADFAKLKTQAISVNHYLYLYRRPTSPTEQPEIFKINLSSLNNDLVTNNIVKEKTDEYFFIDSISISNKAKDSFTVRSSYRVEINFAFTYFEHLTKNIIPATRVKDDTKVNIQPISLIAVDTSVAAPVAAARDVVDNVGLILVEELELKDPQIFSKTREGLGGNKIYKNYHLILEKHEFNLSSKNRLVAIPYENTLKLSFTSFEADEASRPKASGGLPTSANLYALGSYANVVNNRSFFIQNAGLYSRTERFDPKNFLRFQPLETISQEITNLQKAIERNREVINCHNEAVTKKETNNPFYNLDPNKLESSISYLKKTISTLEKKYRLTIMSYIIYRCNVYGLEIDDVQLKTFEQIDKWGNFKKNFSVLEATSAATTGWFAASFLGDIALGIIAPEAELLLLAKRAYTFAKIAGAVGGAAYATKQAWDKSKDPTTVSAEVDIDAVRRAITNTTIKITDESSGAKSKWFSSLSKAYAVASPDDATKRNTIFDPDDASNKLLQELIDKFDDTYGIPIPAVEIGSSPAATKQKILFVTFKDIIKLMNELDQNIYFASGGKLVRESLASTAQTFINCLDIPIEFNTFITFLKNRVLQRDKLIYSMDEFIRDAFNDLLKFDAAINQISPIIPSSIRMTYSLHDSSKPEFSDFKTITNGSKSVNILNAAEYNKFKKSLLSTKIFNINETFSNLVKIFTIGCEQDYTKVNFYNDYIAKAGTTPTLRKDFNSPDFQNYIIDQQEIACLLNEYVDTKNSIKFSKTTNFTRQDNPQLLTGNALEQSTYLKIPYQFNVDLSYYITFFLDISSLIFVVPPGVPFDANNKFGFGGLYVVSKSDSTFYFPNYKHPIKDLVDSKLTIGGLHVSYCDYVEPVGGAGGGTTPTLTPNPCDVVAGSIRVAPIYVDSELAATDVALGASGAPGSVAVSREYLGTAGGRVF
jgi:hypothetical protein